MIINITILIFDIKQNYYRLFFSFMLLNLRWIDIQTSIRLTRSWYL